MMTIFGAAEQQQARSGRANLAPVASGCAGRRILVFPESACALLADMKTASQPRLPVR
jgi:hypothetical protein